MNRIYKRASLVRIVAVLIANELLDSLGQYCFKKAAIGSSSASIQSMRTAIDFAYAMLSNGFFWLGLLAVSVVLIVWSTVLSKVDLSVAMPITAFNYVFVSVNSVVLLHEHIPAARWIGIILILIGVAVVSSSSDKKVLALTK